MNKQNPKHPKRPKLHVVIDPLCGWCYAAAPLLDEANRHFDVELHGGGLFIGERRRQVSAEFRQFAVGNDRRIEALTGQPFGSAYVDGLLNDNKVLLDSAKPIAALLAVRALGGDSVQLLHDLQVAYYQHGKWLSQIDNLTHVAEQQGIEAKAFTEAYQAVLPTVDEHLVNSRHFLAKVGGQGFPTFALQTPEGEFIRLNHADYYGKPAAWGKYLAKQSAQYEVVERSA